VTVRQNLVGVISDTHGLVRPEAVQHLRGCELIVHCGDIGDPAVLEALRDLAPVRAVRGNIDKGAWAASFPSTDIVEVGSHRLYVLHDLAELDVDPAAAGFSAVLSGHSHKPCVEERQGVLFINPGSAGPRRFTLPVSVAHLVLRSDACEATIVRIVG
jgi:putative phosphoesterase